MNQKAKQILQRVAADKLPNLPHVLIQLLEICHAERPSYDQIANVLKQDPALLVQFNSLHHQYDGHNCEQDTSGNSLEQTLEHLGINAIKSTIVTATIHQYFSHASKERSEFLKNHWQHSLCCAGVAESIAKLCNYKQSDEAYTAGLLHDIGQLVLETSYPEKYAATLAQLSKEDYFHTLDIQAFATTHQQVGSAFLKHHGFSSFICDAVLYHHEQIEQILDAHPLVKITFLANTLSSKFFRIEDQEVFDDAKTLLGLDKSVLLEILDKSQERVENTAKELDLKLPVEGIDEETAKQHQASDEFIQLQLAEQVKNIALLDGVHQCTSRSEGQHSLLRIISQHVYLLFGVNNSILFLYDALENRVHASSANEQLQQVNDLSIPLAVNRSLVTDALINKKITHSFDDDTSQLSIIDRQLISISQLEGIICLPMLTDDSTVGTLVLGVDSAQYENLHKQLPLLMRFINEAAYIINSNNLIGDPGVKIQENGLLQQKIHEVLHEVRNPLSIMNNYLGILSFKLESDKPAQEDVQTIKSEIERISTILNRLTEDEGSSDELCPIDINAIISDLTNVFQSSLFSSKNIQISLDLDERIETLQSNANALKQIYTNLVKNAVEALPANGEVMVYTQDNVNVDGIQHIEISIADNGPGIDAAILPNLFSPVDTNKGEEHAGLGLTIVKNLVSELHGSISCRSSSEGTSFHILLPR